MTSHGIGRARKIKSSRAMTRVEMIGRLVAEANGGVLREQRREYSRGASTRKPIKARRQFPEPRRRARACAGEIGGVLPDRGQVRVASIRAVSRRSMGTDLGERRQEGEAMRVRDGGKAAR